MLLSAGFVIFLVGIQVSTVRACDGYEIVLKQFAACDGATHFVPKDVNVTLTEECKIVFAGCGTYKGFKTALLKYDIKINPTNTPFKGMLKDLDLKGDADVCQELKGVQKSYQDIMKSLNFPASCPAVENTVCSSDSTTIDITKYSGYKQVLPIASAMGPTTGDITIAHDTGNTCLKFELVVQKKSIFAKGIVNPFKNMFGKKKKKT